MRGSAVKALRWVLVVGWLALSIYVISEGIRLGYFGRYADTTIIVIVATWSAFALGIFTWGRRPDRPTGPLLTAAAVLAAVSTLRSVTSPWPASIGYLTQAATPALVVPLLLGASRQRLTPGHRRLVWAAVVVPTVLGLAYSLVWVPASAPFSFTVVVAPNRLAVGDLAGLARALDIAAVSARFVLGMAAVVIVGRELRRRGRTQMRDEAAVAAAAAAWVVAGVVGPVLRWINFRASTGDGSSTPFFSAVDFGLPALGLLLVATTIALSAMVRRRVARGGVADLVADLAGTLEPGSVTTALARALDDPTLTVAYWRPDVSRWVDDEGRTVTLDEDDVSRRATTVITRDGERLAAVTHAGNLDAGVTELAAATAAVALALDNERLRAATLAQIADVEASRARLIDAAGQARARLERQLAQGPARIVDDLARQVSALATEPGAASRVLDTVAAGLRTALAELRDVSHGIHPSVLAQQGLDAALDHVADAAGVALTKSIPPDRLPASVETAIYAVAAACIGPGALPVEVTVDVIDDELRVQVEGGRGVDADDAVLLADRFAAIGGELVLVSAKPRFRARLPAAAGTI
ncbi:MAG: hypothetical protein QOG03_2349 [Actinomycetota bacterium]|jgi:signal transduction histidine kinase|nr:hypothetical protein [Actinomycetota bacterium]